MGKKRRVSERTSAVLDAAIEEIERLESEGEVCHTKFKRFRKRGAGVCADKIIAIAVKSYMRNSRVFDFDYSSFRSGIKERLTDE